MTDRIEKSVEVEAPIERVWRAISDHREFGSWFRVRIDQPFATGEESTGQMTYPGFEHYPWRARVVAMEEPHLFAYEWPHTDGSEKVREDWTWTRVEFRLEKIATGTRVTVTEYGFDQLPAERRAEAYRLNEGGWEEQMRNIAAYVGG